MPQEMQQLLLTRPLSSVVVAWLAAALVTSTLCSFIADAEVQGREVNDVCSQSQINGYLSAIYRCRPKEFLEVVFCGSERRTIACQSGKYIAVHSATIGRLKSLSDCSASAVRNETVCDDGCVISEVNAQCLGKRACRLGANDKVFNGACRLQEGDQHTILRLLFTCAMRNVTRVLQKGIAAGSQLDGGCQEGGDIQSLSRKRQRKENITSPHAGFTSTFHFATRKTPPPPAKMQNKNRSKGEPPRTDPRTSTTATPPSANQTAFEHPTNSMEVVLSSVEELELRTNISSSSPSMYLHSISELLWTWKYVTDNAEKGILYCLCGLCLGIIILLIAFMLRLCRSTRPLEPAVKPPVVAPRLTDSSDSVKWRSAESDSSLGDTRTPEGEDEETEAVPGCHHQSFARSWHHSNPPGGTWPPSATPNKLAQVTTSNNCTGTNGVPLDHPPGAGPDGFPLLPKGTQSLHRGTAASRWMDGDVDHPAQTLQPARNYYR